MWATKFVSILTLFSFLFVSFPVRADDTAFPPVPSSTVQSPAVPVIVPVKPGYVVLWPGLLLNPAAVAQIKVNLDSAKEQCDIVTKKAVDQQKAQGDFQLANQTAESTRVKSVLEANLKSRIGEVVDLQKRLEQSEKDRPNVYLWTGLGVGVGMVVTVLTVFAVSQASK